MAKAGGASEHTARRHLGVALAACAAAALVKAFAIDLAPVDGESMRPAFEPGEIVLIWKLAYGLHLGDRYLARWREPGAGDVVAVRLAGRRVLKRVAATGPAALPREGGGSVAVPDGTVFLLGDAAGSSNDSRDYGPVPVGEVEGRVFGLVRGVRP